MEERLGLVVVDVEEDGGADRTEEKARERGHRADGIVGADVQGDDGDCADAEGGEGGEGVGRQSRLACDG